MKKITSLLLVICMILLFAVSCGGTDQTQTSDTTAQTTTAATTAPDVETADPDSLVMHLDFSAESIVDGQYYRDLSGNDHHGYITGNVGKNTDNVQFYGGDNSGYITVKDHPDLNFTAKQSFTLVIKFKVDTSMRGGCIVQKGFADSRPAYFGLWVGEDDIINLGISANSKKNYPTNDAIDEEWHQAVIIQDAQAGTVLFFIDNKLQTSTFPKSNEAPAKAMKLTSKGEDLTIGTCLYDFFAGTIDDIKLYNYAVPEKEVLSEYPTNVHSLDRFYYEYTEESGSTFTLPCRIYYPTGYSEENGEKYPVVISLHGHGECGKDNVGQLRNSAGYVEKLMARDDCIVIVPQCRCDNGVSMEWVASNHRFDVTDRKYNEKATLAMRALLSYIETVKADPKVDTDRIYAFGFSMGGFGVWEMLIRQPDTFAAAIIFSGAGIPSMADKVLDIDIRGYHGMADETVPYSGLQLMEDAIKALGGTKFTATYFEGVDHNGCMAAASEKDGNVFDWLLAQTKAD